MPPLLTTSAPTSHKEELFLKAPDGIPYFTNDREKVREMLRHFKDCQKHIARVCEKLDIHMKPECASKILVTGTRESIRALTQDLNDLFLGAPFSTSSDVD